MPLPRLLIAAVIGLLAGAAAAALQFTHSPGGVAAPLFALESAAQDVALQARQPESYLQVAGSTQVPVRLDPRDALVIVAIDERTIAELGAYNGGYPRRYYADVLDEMLADPP